MHDSHSSHSQSVASHAQIPKPKTRKMENDEENTFDSNRKKKKKRKLNKHLRTHWTDDDHFSSCFLLSFFWFFVVFTNLLFSLCVFCELLWVVHTSTNSKLFENKTTTSSRRWMLMTKEMWNFISSSMNPNKCDDKWHDTPPRTVDSRHKTTYATPYHISFFDFDVDGVLFSIRSDIVCVVIRSRRFSARPLAVICCRAITFEINEENKKFEEKIRRKKRRRWLNFKLCHAKRNLNLVWDENIARRESCVCAECQTLDQRHTMCHVMPLAVGSLANVTRQCFDIEYNQNDCHPAPRPQCVHFSSPNASVRSVPFRSFCV